MNFYQFHIGDYAAHTKHLGLMEDLAYRRMIDLYYTSESPLPLDVDRIARLIGMREHKEEILCVLQDFFTENENGYVSKRCEKEISSYKAKACIAKSNGRLGGRPSKKEPDNNLEKTNDKPSGLFAGFEKEPTHNQEETRSKANQEPITINQEPITRVEATPTALQTQDLPKKIVEKSNGTRLPNDWVLPKSWGDWALAERAEWQPENVRHVADSFRDYWVSAAGKDARKADWEATWRNWVRKEKTFANARASPSTKPSLYEQNRAASERAKALIFGDKNATE